MTTQVNIAGAWKSAQAFGMIAGAWKPLVIWQNVAGVWKRATSGGTGGALSASADPAYVSGARSKSFATPVPTNSTTVTASGGAGSYAYSWGAQSGWTIANASAATTSFTALAVGQDETRDATFTCTITDILGATVSVTVDASASNYYVGGGSGPLL